MSARAAAGAPAWVPLVLVVVALLVIAVVICVGIPRAGDAAERRLAPFDCPECGEVDHDGACDQQPVPYLPVSAPLTVADRQWLEQMGVRP